MCLTTHTEPTAASSVAHPHTAEPALADIAGSCASTHQPHRAETISADANPARKAPVGAGALRKTSRVTSNAAFCPSPCLGASVWGVSGVVASAGDEPGGAFVAAPSSRRRGFPSNAHHNTRYPCQSTHIGAKSTRVSIRRLAAI